MTTITTVGYGDVSFGSTTEIAFVMVVEFIGLLFFSFLMGSINSMLAGTQNFEEFIQNTMDELDHWMLSLEKSNNNKRMSSRMYRRIKKTVQDAFVNDFNLLIEEYDFYFYLPPCT
jgi:hypothetical protein